MSGRGRFPPGGGRGGGDRGGGRGGRGGRGGGGRGGGGGGRGGGGGSTGDVPIYRPLNGSFPPEPDNKVTEVENASQKSLSLGKLSLSEAYPQRPAFGTEGTPVTLWANYVQLMVDPKLVLYKYDISVNPVAVGKKLVRIVNLLLEDQAFAALRNQVVTDFKSTLVSRQKLPEDEATYDVRYRSEGEDEAKQRATECKVLLKYTNTLPVDKLIEYLTSSTISSDYNDKLPMIQALNIFLNHYSKSNVNLTTIGASRDFPLNPNYDGIADLGSGLQAIRGFFASVRAATARILVNVNVSYGAFYKRGTLDALMYEYGDKSMSKLAGFLKNVKVSPTHLKPRTNKAGKEIPRRKAIAGLARPKDGKDLAHPPRIGTYGAGPKSVEFWLDQPAPPAASKGGKGGKGSKSAKSVGVPSSTGGKYITVYDFFKQTYGITLKYPELPVVNVGTPENPTYLPPEVCNVLPGQSANAKLSPDQTASMIKHAVRKPGQNASFITRDGIGIVGLSQQTNPLLARFGMSATPELITVRGRVLAGPQVKYNNNVAQVVSAGAWNAMNHKFTTAGIAKTWGWMVLSFPRYPTAFRGPQDFNTTLGMFMNVLTGTGIRIGPPKLGKPFSFTNEKDPDIEAKLEFAAKTVDLLFVTLPAGNMEVYDRIKYLCDVKFGMATICSVGSKLAKNQDQYFRNLALKFNLKLGGNNQEVKNQKLSFLEEDKTMVVGIDVTHPSPGSSDSAPSVAGMVANIDKRLGQWPAILSIQSKARQEMVSDLKEMLKSRLQLWRTKGRHAALPENILVYRDGVSEGQYDIVLKKELPLLREACTEMYPPGQQKEGLPRMTVVVVGKRHHTRFYPTSPQNADRSANCQAGTVVDRGVTEARNWDFFLQAHAAIQGTARPAHYFVIHDEIFRRRGGGGGGSQKKPAAAAVSGNEEDTLEQVTQSLCYVYGRATRAVSICTPAYYADIVCERARRYLKEWYDPSVDSSDVASVASGSVGGGGGGGAGAMDSRVKIHDRLKDSMFYI